MVNWKCTISTREEICFAAIPCCAVTLVLFLRKDMFVHRFFKIQIRLVLQEFKREIQKTKLSKFKTLGKVHLGLILISYNSTAINKLLHDTTSEFCEFNHQNEGETETNEISPNASIGNMHLGDFTGVGNFNYLPPLKSIISSNRICL